MKAIGAGGPGPEPLPPSQQATVPGGDRDPADQAGAYDLGCTEDP